MRDSTTEAPPAPRKQPPRVLTAEEIAALPTDRFRPTPRTPLQAPGNPHLGQRRTTHRKPQGGAYFSPGNPDDRQFRIAVSVSQANAVAREKADARTFARWFAGLSPADQTFARAHKLHRPMPADGFRQAGQSEDALDLAEREIIPEADIRGSRNGQPIVRVENAAIEEMEPQTSAVDVATLSPAEIRAAAEDFGDALRWALGVAVKSGKADATHHLVLLGQRSAVLIAGLRGDLASGLVLDPDLARSFLESFHDFRLRETLERLQASGAIYSRVLEWMRRARDLAGLGERLQLVAYELRPDLIDAGTLADLGQPTNKTRQAIDKGVNCLRDTFAGLKAGVMRSDTTRLRCQQAQLSPE